MWHSRREAPRGWRVDGQCAYAVGIGERNKHPGPTTAKGLPLSTLAPVSKRHAKYVTIWGENPHVQLSCKTNAAIQVCLVLANPSLLSEVSFPLLIKLVSNNRKGEVGR